MRKIFSSVCLIMLIVSCSAEDDTTPSAPATPTPIQYTLTVSAQEGGTVSNVGGTFDEGSSINIIATPQEGYAFVGWQG